MRLIDCFSDTLSFTLKQLETIRAGETPDYDSLRLGVERTLAEHAGEFSVGGFSREQYDAAKFPVIVFIDEAILQSNWAHKDQWSRELLQRAHFNTANGGAEFFEKLDGLSPFNPGERDIREVFYYCLALGFTGRFYRSGDRTRREEIRQANFRLLTEGPGRLASLDGAVLFPEALHEAVPGKTRLPRRRQAALYYGLPLLALLVAFFLFRADIVAAAEYLVTVI